MPIPLADLFFLLLWSHLGNWNSPSELPIEICQPVWVFAGLRRMVMSISAISANSYSDYSAQSTFQKLKQEFQQLGSDLQAGNLAAAESDYTTLQQDMPQQISSSTSQSTDPIAQAFSQLSQDLQAGNLTAAQQDYATIQKDFQAKATQGSEGAESHHHHHGGGSSNGGSSEISQLMTQLGQELKSGSLSSAQQTYTSLEKDFQQFSQNGWQQGQTSSGSTSNAVSVSA
jgi:outer membrane protein assembly factor BamD (BamD/ComL family)